ncbi:MAG: PAS domain-containing protein, partial [Thermoanaerobaculaceae bacterium]|nr:PAS domain-containing protein [Thermoanaerobaculaceae bacterium]
MAKKYKIKNLFFVFLLIPLFSFQLLAAGDISGESESFFSRFNIYFDILDVFFILLILLLLLYLIQKERKLYKEILNETKSAEKSKSEFEELFKNLPIGLYISTPEGKITKANPAFLRILGYQDIDELKKISITSQIYKLPEMRKIFKEAVEKEGKITAFESEIKRKNGNVIFVRESAYAQFNDEGKTTAFIGAMEDITKQKLSELELNSATKLWERIFNNINEIIFLTDNQRRIIKMNKAFLNYYSISQEKALNSFCYEICHKDKKILENCPLSQSIQSKKREIVKTEVEGRTLVVTCDPIFDEEGNFIGAVHISRDITEEEEMLKQSNKLRNQLQVMQKIEALGRLAGGIAHDFNNILSVILGNVEFAIQNCQKNDVVIGYLSEIKESAERSAELTRQLLGFARKQTFDPKPLDINRHISQMKNMLKRLLGENISLIFEFEKELQKVNLDPAQLDQVIINLLINSRDAIGEGKQGKILIETKNVIIEKDYLKTHAYAKEGRYVMVGITDSGSGIKKEYIDKIFEPFFTTKESGKGTGLGLATVYGIVRQNQGFINVYSEEGEGTTFKVYFPELLAQSVKEEVVQKANSVVLKKTILLVEDEEAILKMIKLMLENNGNKVFAFSTP